jgi:hypothetical protein
MAQRLKGLEDLLRDKQPDVLMLQASTVCTSHLLHIQSILSKLAGAIIVPGQLRPLFTWHPS